MEAPRYFAHSLEGQAESKWEDLESHLRAVSRLASEFAGTFGAEPWGALAGLWHDLGKYQPGFQRRLRGSGESIEHAGIGAAFASSKSKTQGLPLAFIIAGHHAGLANLISAEETSLSPLEKRLAENRALLPAVLPSIPADLLASHLPPIPERFRSAAGGKEGVRSFELWIRFLFSSLVDADYLATEEFYSPELRQARTGYADIPSLRRQLDEHLDGFVARLPPEKKASEVNRRRAEVLAACREAASLPPGLFSLTVPTGGGKTLASMSFALRHAERFGLRRVIAAIPFTSIIEQNARVYREALGESNVVEHHSGLDPLASEERNREAEIRRRLAAENWDAPVIVTTNVQLFESLFANATSRCRKLHNLAKSVVVLDEAQALPPGLLAPILEALRELTGHYGCTVVLSTATQPAFNRRESFPEGLSGVREIVPDPRDLALGLRRIQPASWPDLSAPPRFWPDLAGELAQHERVLAIVHRRQDARTLAGMLPEDGRFHLSALMCPAHRSARLDEVRARLAGGGPCRLISTQLIEAGVDVDFPCVYRCLGGLDSLAQAAGRCNREGGIPEGGRVVFFRAETAPPPGIPQKGLEAIETLLRDRGGQIELDDASAYEEYFRNLYFRCDRDAQRVQPQRQELNFATVARRFWMIEDGYTRPVVVPYDASEERLEALRRTGPNRFLLRALQPFTVCIPERNLHGLLAAGALELVAETVYALTPLFGHLYDSQFGLILDSEPQPDAAQLVQ